MFAEGNNNFKDAYLNHMNHNYQFPQWITFPLNTYIFLSTYSNRWIKTTNHEYIKDTGILINILSNLSSDMTRLAELEASRTSYGKLRAEEK